MTKVLLTDYAGREIKQGGYLLYQDDVTKELFTSNNGSVFNAATILPSHRELLTADRSYYVATTGSDSNDGSVSTPFLTVQKAIDTITGSFDLGVHDAYVYVGNGSYTGQVELKTVVGAGTIYMVGDTTTPSNVVMQIAAPVTGCFGSFGGTRGSYNIAGFKLLSNAYSNGFGLAIVSPISIVLGNMEFGASTRSHILTNAAGAVVQCLGGYTISGGAQNFIEASNSSVVLLNSPASPDLTFVGTINYSTAFINVSGGAAVTVANLTYTGTCTGRKALVTQGFIKNSSGDINTTFPGSTPALLYSYSGGAALNVAGSGGMMQSYTVLGAPSASDAGVGATIHISNPTSGNPRLYSSDGTNWYDGAGTLLA